jgi:hypothetical protein
MKLNFNKSENPSNITQKASDDREDVAKSFDGTIEDKGSSEQIISASIGKSTIRFSRSQLAILGAILIAIIVTLVLVPKGANFCFLSSCDRTLPDSSLAHNFWSLAGGFGMGAILTLMGLSAPIAILGSLGIWLLIQTSL